MKRILLYIMILAAMLAVPVKPLDVGKLLPVEVVSVYKEGDWTVMETDTGDRGLGGTAVQALQNMQDTASGIIYLDTAEYLLLTEETEQAAGELRSILKENVRLCLMTKPLKLEEVASFLNVHGRLPKLKHWKTGAELPVLSTFADSLTFLKKDEKSS